MLGLDYTSNEFVCLSNALMRVLIEEQSSDKQESDVGERRKYLEGSRDINTRR